MSANCTLYIYIYIYIKYSWPIEVKGDTNSPFSITTTLECGTSFSAVLHFTLDMYLIMLSIKQRDYQVPFLSLWYDSTWD